MDFIPTRAAKVISANDFEAVVYESHKSAKSKLVTKESNSKLKEKSHDKNLKEMDMKRVRFEVIKFGMKGLDTKTKEEAKVDLAVRLGAKPPKNKFVNYKKLKEEKKLEMLREQKRLRLQQLGKTKLGMSNAKGKTFDKKRKKDKNILQKYGKAKPPSKLVSDSKRK